MMTALSEYDEVVINLKVIGALEKNNKLYTKGSLLNVESASMVPEGMRRWLRGDNRDEAIKKIDIMVNKAINLRDTVPNIVNYIPRAKIGLENFKETYSTCVQTRARIDAIIDRITNTFLSIQDNSEEDEL